MPVKDSIDDLKAEIEEIRNENFRLEDDSAFVLSFLKAYLTDNEDEALRSVMQGKGDANFDAILVDDNNKQIHVVQVKLREKLGARADRVNTLNAFRRGVIQVVAAIRCLDEGIDIPSCETAFILASSRNPRQFIQRRGGILKRSPGKTSAGLFGFHTPAAPFWIRFRITRKSVAQEGTWTYQWVQSPFTELQEHIRKVGKLAASI